MNHVERREFWSEVFMLQNSVTPKVKLRMLIFGVVATLVWAAGTYTTLIPTSGVAPYEVVGVVLALLLVLRTNAGYDRWYEGRKLWGGIVNQTRNLAQVGLTYGPQEEAWRTEFIRWIAAFPHACRHSLREECSREALEDMRPLVGDAGIEELAAAQHMPMHVARRLAGMLSRAVQRDQLDRFAFLQAEQQRSLLIDHVGACERILKTPLAKAFSVKIRRFLFLYLVALPFGIFDKAGMMTPAIVMLVAYPLLSLDQIGVELQNPFSARRLSHLPLNDICQGIQANVFSALDDEERDLDERQARRAELVA
ncbi:MAG: hypothetical protein K8T91_09220 [Planctomycetes bacterium]|nr:hypothetical protein [Planctomycetota bacterium]